jgi:non-ribosomal peptide synthase protein (TIGR01720 family)
VESRLVEIWEGLLDRRPIGIRDNYFELGGDSIITMQLVSRARRAGIKLEVRDVFSHQTILQLSKIIEGGKGKAEDVDQGIAVGEAGLTPIQQSYFERGGDKVYNQFNQSVLLRVDESIGLETLSGVLSQVVMRHDSLRMVYRREGGEWKQSYGESRLSIIEEDFRGQGRDRVFEKLSERSGEYQRSLDIELGEVGRVVWYRLPEGLDGNRLLIVLHHLVVDGVSWRILLEDVQLLLEGRPLGVKGISYGTWYKGLEKYSKSRRLQQQSGFWSGVVKASGLGERKEGVEVRYRDLRTIRVVLPEVGTRRLLQSSAKGYRTEINDLLLCALSKTLCEWSNKDRVVIGVEGHGREGVVRGLDTSATVGWFTSLYPVLLEPGVGVDYGPMIKRVKEQMRGVPDRGIGYGVLRYINKKEELRGRDPWEVTFNYLGQLDNVVREGGIVGVASESVGESMSGDYPVGYKLSLDGYVSGGKLVIDWSYSALHYGQGEMELLSASYIKVLEGLIAESDRAAREGLCYSPSDFNLGGEVGQKELDDFLEEKLEGGKRRREEMEGLYRLSSLQEGMLFHSLLEEVAGSYIVQFACVLSGLDEDLFRRSWMEVLRRHSILRSGFYYDELSIPVQCVYRSVELEVGVKDWRGMSAGEQELLWREYKSGDRTRGFDVGRAPLIRVGLRQIGDGGVYRMLWTSHHLVYDGWSLPVIVEELLGVYAAMAGRLEPEEVKEDRYEDYIRYLEGRDKEEEESYWRGYLSGLAGGTLLPFTTSATGRNTGKGLYLEEALVVKGEPGRQVEEYARRHWLTVNTIIQGVWSYLLYRYTGNRAVVYGVTVSGRPEDLVGVEKRVGMYINTLPVRMLLEDERSVLGWLESIQAEQVQSRRYQYTSLSDIMRWSGIKTDLFDSLVVFENYPVSKALKQAEGKEMALGAREVEVHQQNNYLLSVVVSNTGGEIHVAFNYNSELLPGYYVDQIRSHFERILMQMVGNEDIRVGELRILSREEEKLLLRPSTKRPWATQRAGQSST